ncbi:transcription factor protein isoform X2 [Ciona intestinalis]
MDSGTSLTTDEADAQVQDPSSKEIEEPILLTQTEYRKENRRRKNGAKPRKIVHTESNSGESKNKNLDLVLQRVFKNADSEHSKMIDIHETLAISHHQSPKTMGASSTSPGSVGSPSSIYSSERPEETCQVTRSPEPFVRVRPRSNGSETGPPLYEATVQHGRTSSSEGLISREQTASSPGKETTKAEISGTNYNHGNMDSAVHGTPSSYSSPTEEMNGVNNPLMLPTMVPSTNSIMSSSMLPIMAVPEQNSRFAEKQPKQPVIRHERFNGRGIIGSSGSAARLTSTPPPEERSQYKRPPHTYPALIASAILDSPGHLITLRGIYDYIMNHFPYYKYCHDKSAWQNSIRHNLSLNQCFVKVPRYENAAKSNYWTMTREGFEEFGNENSFKRRRRRGAALAPISAYKAKKYQNEGKNGGKTKQAHNDSNKHATPASSEATTVAQQEGVYTLPFPPQLMALNPGAWGTPDNNAGYHPTEDGKGRKRAGSPGDKDGLKHPRMMVLKQGDGPSLDSSMINKAAWKRDGGIPGLLPTTSQQWINAAQRSLMASTGMMMPSLQPTASSENGYSKASGFEDAYNEAPILLDNIEIGSEVTIRYDTSEIPIHHFRCRFCPYTYVSNGSLLLEQHARLIHQVELTNAKAKAVAAAALAKSQEDRMAAVTASKPKDTADRMMTLQNMVSGMSPRSVMAAAQSGAQSILAAAQASGNSAAQFPYSGRFASGLLDESMIRSLAEQVNNQQQHAEATAEHQNGMDAYAYQRQQALNTIQQAASGASAVTPSLPQEQLRLFYQQLAMQNPFLANSANSAFAAAAANFPRQMPSPDMEQASQLKNLWQYQQKILELSQMKSGQREGSKSPEKRPSSQPENRSQPSAASPCRSPASNPDVDAESKKNIHAWKQCGRCDFTAKGVHGLDLHYRKAHASSEAVTSSSASYGSDVMPCGRSAPNLELSTTSSSATEKVSPNGYEMSFRDQQCDSPLTSSAYPTPPLSNSPSYIKKNFTPLDLSGAEKNLVDKNTSSTQTSPAASDVKSRTCRHCDVIFGDEMMHALHMSCHDKTDPFKCTICSQKCHEKYYFNVHLLRGLHQTNNGGQSESSQEVATEVENREVTEADARRSRSNSTCSDAR